MRAFKLPSVLRRACVIILGLIALIATTAGRDTALRRPRHLGWRYFVTELRRTQYENKGNIPHTHGRGRSVWGASDGARTGRNQRARPKDDRGGQERCRRAMPAMTIPGAITLTRIPSPASSRAIARASIRTPAFETEYAEISGQGISPTHEPVKMMWPGVPALDHEPCRGLADVEAPGDVDVQMRLPLRLRDLEERRRIDDSGIADRHIERRDGGQCRIDRGAVGDVHLPVCA